jgi:prepilin-type processing-associated H-X9-DG protein
MSGFVSLLPFYEEQSIYDRARSHNFGPVPWQYEFGTWTVRIPTLLCPSDTELHELPLGNNSYKFCVGTTVYRNHDVWGDDPNGVYCIIGDPRARKAPYRMRDIRDGASNTVAMSERRLGNYELWYDISNVALNINAGDAATLREWYNICWATASEFSGKRYNRNGVTVFAGAKPGERWADGRPYYSGFTTVIPPNGPSCIIDSGEWNRGVFTASSRHPNIVNVLMADGGVRPIVNGIDLRTWWGLGTRASGEVLGEF